MTGAQGADDTAHNRSLVSVDGWGAVRWKTVRPSFQAALAEKSSLKTAADRENGGLQNVQTAAKTARL